MSFDPKPTPRPATIFDAARALIGLALQLRSEAIRYPSYTPEQIERMNEEAGRIWRGEK